MKNDNLIIGDKTITNRLFIGTGKFPKDGMIKPALEISGVEVVTVALRRVDFGSESRNMLQYIPKNCILMPNTSGARTAGEAVRIARIAKAAGCGNFVKIEVINDNKYLMPDNLETLRATEILSKEGFVTLPYMSPDLSVAKKMKEVGAAAIMPLGSPIGSNQGLKTKELVRIMIEEIDLPIIVDAGIGKPSEAAQAMEMGAAAVLCNTAIACADDPVQMALAFSLAVKAGRTGFLAGLGAVSTQGEASSPLTGFLRDNP